FPIITTKLLIIKACSTNVLLISSIGNVFIEFHLAFLLIMCLLYQIPGLFQAIDPHYNCFD
ncbi:MAG: hypothetical protein K2K74_10460, partial [Lachnospiraceae bacterium]|nr:hypothetical protein [Lachnospiraceae bacterium]